MSTLKNAWSKEEFEDTVAAALITCFEYRIRKNRGAGPNTLNEERAELIRNSGPYVPGSDREVLFRDNGPQFFDMDNDRLPISGCFAQVVPTAQHIQGQYNGWFRSIYIRQSDKLNQGWRRRDGGKLYELVYMATGNEFAEGERSYFSVTKDGRIVACEAFVRGNTGGRSGRHEEVCTDPHQLQEVEVCAAMALQYLADQRFCWTIEAKEQRAFVKLGCQEEEIKSLLYARTLPLSETGRRRPILHLVEAHKRRMRNGTEVNVQSSLRGIQTVEIGGTLFTVRPPSVVLPLLSKPSRDRVNEHTQGGAA